MTVKDRKPGARLRRFAEGTFDRATLDRVVLPAIADLQHECGDTAGASRLVRLRAYWGIWKTLALCLLINWGRHGRPVVGGVVARMTIIFPIVVGVVMIPAFNVESAGAGLPAQLIAQLLLTSLPQAAIPALPIALFFAVALEQRSKSLRHLVPVIFAMSLVCALVMMTVTFAVVPRANQAYARSVHEYLKAEGRPDQVSFGPGEWTFTELVRKAWSDTPARDSASARQALGMRLATSTLPIVLGFLALGIAGYPRQHALFTGMWLLIMYVAALRAAAPSSFTAPSVRGVCLVNALFVLAGLGLVWLRPNPLDSEPEVKGTIIS